MIRINRLTSDVNMEDESLITQKIIYDVSISAYTNAGNSPITKEIRQSFPCEEAIASAKKDEKDHAAKAATFAKAHRELEEEYTEI